MRQVHDPSTNTADTLSAFESLMRIVHGQCMEAAAALRLMEPASNGCCLPDGILAVCRQGFARQQNPCWPACHAAS
ncbi:hypothetical protein LHK_01922 [Laribacter hongkongensis HLHK9]|uniref:Uncharacterized protein n=1 Tax=Laribacter hongkongensis (strain HLHK9) TaxID=557598 RepID=C1D8W6_LARHH|nr:hypothetical protein LHK_01922 [Laribacter hongkongensis HLHK9]